MGVPLPLFTTQPQICFFLDIVSVHIVISQHIIVFLFSSEIIYVILYGTIQRTFDLL
jgi:hypothetical protein